MMIVGVTKRREDVSAVQIDGSVDLLGFFALEDPIYRVDNAGAEASAVKPVSIDKLVGRNGGEHRQGQEDGKVHMSL